MRQVWERVRLLQTLLRASMLRIITTIQDNTAGTTTYTYNADGQRTRRKTGTQETWQIYGMDGELLAEYPQAGATNAPQKEYD
jgi:YD repeat-containing protein